MLSERTAKFSAIKDVVRKDSQVLGDHDVVRKDSQVLGDHDVVRKDSQVLSDHDVVCIFLMIIPPLSKHLLPFDCPLFKVFSLNTFYKLDTPKINYLKIIKI